MTIPEVLQLPSGTVVDHVFGTLVSVGEYETKQRPDGEPYQAQAFTLKDGNDILVGTMYDHYPMQDKIGQVLYLCSMKSRNGRFGGVTTFQQANGNIFTKSKPLVSIRVSKLGAIHNAETFKMLKRKPETKKETAQ